MRIRKSLVLYIELLSLLNTFALHNAYTQFLRIPLQYNSEIGYSINLNIGTPQQIARLVLDSDNYGIRLFISDDISNPFEPTKSLTNRFCIKGNECSLNLINQSYNCSNTSTDIREAEFYQYSLWPSLYLNTTIPHTLCEFRAEGLDVITLPIGSNYSKIDHHVIDGEIQLIDAPIKYVQSLYTCSTSDNNTSTQKKIFEQITDDNNVIENRRLPSLHKLKEGRSISGLWGIGGFNCRSSSVMDMLYTASETQILTFDLNHTNPSMTLIKNESLLNPLITWSELPQADVPQLSGYFFLELYSPELCGADLGLNVSSHWGALLDFNNACLGLPSFLWDSIMAWLPVECPNDIERHCQIKESYKHLPLPSLDFELHPPIQTLKSAGIMEKHQEFTTTNNYSHISIPLQRLVLPSGQLCIDRLLPAGLEPLGSQIALDFPMSDKVSSNIGPSALKPPIRLGTLVLQNYFIHLNKKNSSIALTPKNETELSNINCNQKQTCIGQQTYFPPLNTCLNPICNRWFFKRLNPITKNCEYPTSVILALCLLIPFCILADLYADFLYATAIKYAKERCH